MFYLWGEDVSIGKQGATLLEFLTVSGAACNVADSYELAKNPGNILGKAMASLLSSFYRSIICLEKSFFLRQLVNMC